MSSLKDLKMAQILQAFEKAKGSVDVTGIKVKLITEDYYEKAIQFTKDYYTPKEPMNAFFGTGYTDEIIKQWLKSLKLNLSLMFVTESHEEIVGILRMTVLSSKEKRDLSNLHMQSEQMQNKLLFMAHCDEKANFFSHFGATEAFRFLGLAVSDENKRRGLASKLVHVALDMIQNFSIRPVYVKAESSSSYGQKIFERAGFETLYEQPFDAWEVSGKFLKATADHKSRKMYGLQINYKIYSE